MNYLAPIISVVIISLFSLVGIIFLFIKDENKLKKTLIIYQSLKVYIVRLAMILE